MSIGGSTFLKVLKSTGMDAPMQVMQQFHGKSDEELQEFDLPPIDLSMARMKEVSAEWIVAMADYISQSPLILVNGFITSGITGALDGHNGGEEEDNEDEGMSTDEDVSTDEDESTDEDKSTDGGVIEIDHGLLIIVV